MVSIRWFIAGALAVPLFHQIMLAVLNAIGWAARQPFSMEPTTPFGVPQVVSLAFWGGVWGVILGLLLSERMARGRYWTVAFLFGAVAPTLVALFVVAPLKGQPAGGDVQRFLMAGLLNGAWGIGTAALFLLTARAFGRRAG